MVYKPTFTSLGGTKSPMFSQVQGAEESDSDKSIGQGVKFQRALEALDRMSRGFSERWDWGVGIELGGLGL